MARTRKRSRSSGRSPLRRLARRVPSWGWFATWLIGMSALVLLAGQVVVPRVEAREGERRAEADQDLLESVHATLAPLVSLPVRLTVVDGEVTLEGETASSAERESLVEAVRGQEGVEEVRDELVVVGAAPSRLASADAVPEPPEPGPEPEPAPPPDPPDPAEPSPAPPAPADDSDVAGITLVDESGDALLGDEESLALARPYPAPPSAAEPDAEVGPDAPPGLDPDGAPEPLAASEPARGRGLEAPAARPASLSVRVADGALRLSGSIADGDESRLSRFVGPATEAFDPRYVENVVQTAPDVAPVGWLAPLEELLIPLAGLRSPGVEIDADRLALIGTAPTEAARDAALEAAATLFPDHAVDDRMALGTGGADAADADAPAAPRRIAAPAEAPASGPAPDGTPGERREALRAEFEALPDRRILFESGTATFADDSERRIDGIADLLRRHPDVRVEIEGHTDASGAARDNLALSQRRANAVRDALVATGVERDRLVAYGYGEGVPLADNSTPAGRAQNRRIEFRF